MDMEVPVSKQNPADAMHKVKLELEEMRESIRQGTAQADSSQVATAAKVFSELRQRNLAAAEKIG